MRKLFLTALIGLFALTGFSQHILRGTVTAAGEISRPLPGVNVYLPEKETGTVTDERGNYEIRWIAEKEESTLTLQYSSVGYEPKSLTLELQADQSRYRQDIRLQPAVYMIEGLVVKSVQVEEEEPFAYHNLKGEELRSRNIGQDMPFLLRFTPSAVVTSDAGTGFGYNGLRIRGSDATRTNVTINGVPLNDAESQGTFWVNLPDFASSVQNLQIQRGAGTSTNGAGAFGAGVHLSTLQLQPKAYGRLTNALGSFNTRRHALEFGTGLINGEFSLDGRISRIHSDGYIDRATADQKSFYLSAGWWGERSSLQAIVFQGQERTYQAWFGVPAQYVDDEELRTYNPAGLRSDGGFHEDQVDNYQQTHYQLHYQQALPADWTLHLAGHYTRGAGYFEEYKDREQEAALFSPEADFAFYSLPNPVIGGDTLTSTDLIRRRWLDNHYFGSVFSLEKQTSNWTLTLGGAASRYLGQHYGEVIWARFASTSEQGYRYYDADADKTDMNAYAKMDLPLAAGLDAYIDLQVRHVDYKLEALDNSRTDHYRYTFFNPKAGLSWQAGPRSRLYTSFAVAQREPGRFDFLDADPGRTPQPETLYDVELGWRRSWADAQLNVNAYYMYYRDQLALTGEINQDALPVRVNIPESYRLGLELSGLVRPVDRFEVEGALALSDNRIRSFTEFIDNWDTGGQETVEHRNTQLAFSPPVVAHLSAAFDLLSNDRNRLRARWISKYVGRQYLDNTSREAASLDPYFFSDLQLTYDWQPSFMGKISLSVLLRNVLDARFSTNAWTYRYVSSFDARPSDPYARLEQGNTYNLTGFFPQAGRNVMVRLAIDF